MSQQKMGKAYTALGKTEDRLAWVQDPKLKSGAALLVGGFALVGLCWSPPMKVVAAVLGIVLPLAHLVLLFVRDFVDAPRLIAAFDERKEQKRNR